MQTGRIVDLILTLRDRLHAETVRELSGHGIRDLAPSHTALLTRLFERDGLTMMDLADGIGRDKSTITALVRKLSGLGYVEARKDPSDQRVTRVYLSEAGRALRPALEAIGHRLTSRVFQGFDWNDRTALIQLLKRVAANL